MTEPYYEDEYVTLYHGDCLELAELWTGADVLVTDPPYGIALTVRTGSYQPGNTVYIANAIAGDASTRARDEALKLWGENRPAVVFGSWRQARPAATRSLLIWHKAGMAPGPLNAAFMTNHEEVYILGDGWRKSSPPLMSTITTREPRSRAVAEAGHPTPKPLDLMHRLIDRCPPGVVADPFAGSGSTLVAAKQLGRKAIGIELEERYCEIAARRLSQGVLNFGDTND